MIGDRKPPSSEETLRSPPDLWDVVSHCWHFEAKDRIHALEFLEYWDLKTRTHPTPITEEPICPREACNTRRKIVIDFAASTSEASEATNDDVISNGDASELTNIIPDDDMSESTDDDITPERARLALEALPRAKLAEWSAIPVRVSCLAGTRTAVLKEIRAWHANTSTNAPPFFDLDGIAGIGKTTIAHTLAEEAARDGYLAASFFFSRGGEEELSNPTLVFPTLAYQLGHFDPSFLPHFDQAAEIVSGPHSRA
ncbi:hypothetical protein FRB94_003285 [Tulasnella sp. JGI-2019a]|nr:hypothetical protein FRB93_003079 [Tulasnella sp. JGI-2019a]KAG9013215.1 hypothetical protein FRB94_003285 [Tulasnella sp. JGI-2019a]